MPISEGEKNPYNIFLIAAPQPGLASVHQSNSKPTPPGSKIHPFIALAFRDLVNVALAIPLLLFYVCANQPTKLLFNSSSPPISVLLLLSLFLFLESGTTSRYLVSLQSFSSLLTTYYHQVLLYPLLQ